jgi:2-dehydro-3-deoxygalactonokinase
MSDAGRPALPTRLIGLDWGTSSLRAYRMGDDGMVLETRSSDQGMLAASSNGPTGFSRAFADITQGWPVQDVPVIASGMVGAKQGWREAPYCLLPAGIEEVARALVTVEAMPQVTLHIVPGLRGNGAHGAPDVLRGEETQVFGLASEYAATGPHSEATIVLPGTHSKWVQVAQGRVTRFATFMTGELFALLRHHSILAKMMPDPANSDSHDSKLFAQGVNESLQSQVRSSTGEGPENAHSMGISSTGILGQLFAVRTRALMGEVPAAALPSYLSGLLIGEELRGAMQAGLLRSGELTIAGNAALGARYAEALSLARVRATQAADDIAARGLWRVARSAGLLAMGAGITH